MHSFWHTFIVAATCQLPFFSLSISETEKAEEEEEGKGITKGSEKSFSFDKKKEEGER